MEKLKKSSLNNSYANMKKGILLFILSWFICCSFAQLTTGIITVNDCWWQIYNGKASLFRVFGDIPNGVYEVPSTLEYNDTIYPVIGVSSLGENTLNRSIKVCIIPEGIEKITNHPFDNTKIEYLYIPKSCKILGTSFENCPNLKTIIFAGTEVHIGSLGDNFNWATKKFKNPPFKNRILLEEPNDSIVNPEGVTTYVVPRDIKLKLKDTTYIGKESEVVLESLLPEEFICSVNGTYLPQYKVGEYNDSLQIILSEGRFAFQTNIPFNYIVKPANLEIICNDTTREYGNDNPEFKLTYKGFVNNESEAVLDSKGTIVTTANKSSNVGEYDISVENANDNNYNISVIPGKLTIQKAPLTLQAINKSRDYGETNPELSMEITGLKNNESTPDWIKEPSIYCTATKSSPIGNYLIDFTDGIAKNYEITKKKGTLTINKAPLIAKVKDISRIYGQTNPKFSLEFNGLKNDEVVPEWDEEPSYYTTATIKSPIGLYPIEVTAGTAHNYEMKKTNGVITINKAELTIAADNKSRPYYEENPTLTCKYTGFMNGENSSVLTTQPSLKTNAEQASAAGNYPITVSGAEAQNYNIVYKQGNMEVTKRQLTVSTDNYSREYKEENPNFELRYIGFVNNETEDVLINKPTATTQATVDSDAGVYPITINGGVAANYDFLYTNSFFTINKTFQTLTWEQEFDEMETFSQTELNAESTSGLDITYSVIDGNGASIRKVGKITYLETTKAGTIVICAQQTGNNNYYESNKVYKTIRVGKANPSDVNGDGTVDSADIVAVIKEMPDGDMKADVNGDGVIDSADIVAMIKAMK